GRHDPKDASAPQVHEETPAQSDGRLQRLRDVVVTAAGRLRSAIPLLPAPVRRLVAGGRFGVMAKVSALTATMAIMMAIIGFVNLNTMSGLNASTERVYEEHTAPLVHLSK